MRKPPGFTRLFPYIFARSADAYLAFLERGLGGETVSITRDQAGGVRNAHVRFGDTTLMVSEAVAGFEDLASTFYLFVEDADAAVAQAVAAGGVPTMAVADMSYGDRQGGVRDPAGNVWWISQRLVDGPY